jgi:hypothetical protein
MVLVLVSVEGQQYRRFIKTLGKRMVLDSFMTVHGTQAFEQIQGLDYGNS